MTRNLKKFYEQLMDDLSEDTDQRYLEFVKEKPETLVIDNLIFDLEKLDSYFNCAGCKRRDPEAFCCSGHDLGLTRHDLKVIEAALPGVIERFPRLGRALGGKSFWVRGENFERIMRRKANDDCIFLMPGAEGCYLHAYALEKGIDPLELKPYVCSLFPVVVVIIGEEVVITTLNRESKVILEIGADAVPCTKSRGPREDHTLLKSRAILERMFGRKVVERVLGRVFSSGDL